MSTNGQVHPLLDLPASGDRLEEYGLRIASTVVNVQGEIGFLLHEREDIAPVAFDIGDHRNDMTSRLFLDLFGRFVEE